VSADGGGGAAVVVVGVVDGLENVILAVSSNLVSCSWLLWEDILTRALLVICFTRYETC
jgi:hypothetical protein